MSSVMLSLNGLPRTFEIFLEALEIGVYFVIGAFVLALSFFFVIGM